MPQSYDFTVSPYQFTRSDFRGMSVADNGWYLKDLQINEAWKISKGAGVKIAVLDSGYTPHKDIQNVVEALSFVSGETFHDESNHSNSVIGILNGMCKEVCGICSDSQIHSVKILNKYNNGSYDSLEKALEWCLKHDIDIINLSIEAKNPMGGKIEQQLKALDDRGTVVCVSTGNDHSSVGYPAKYDSVFAIGAYDKSGRIAPFSNRGAEIDFAAPGVEIYTCGNNNDYVTATGTSFASPIFAGTVALILGRERFKSNHELKDYLIKNVRDMGEMGPDTTFGWGSIVPLKYMDDVHHVVDHCKNESTPVEKKTEQIILGTSLFHESHESEGIEETHGTEVDPLRQFKDALKESFKLLLGISPNPFP